MGKLDIKLSIIIENQGSTKLSINSNFHSICCDSQPLKITRDTANYAHVQH